MLHLYKKEEIDEAVKLLKSLSTEIIDLIGTRTLVSILTGLAVMDHDPGAQKVFCHEFIMTNLFFNYLFCF